MLCSGPLRIALCKKHRLTAKSASRSLASHPYELCRLKQAPKLHKLNLEHTGVELTQPCGLEKNNARSRALVAVVEDNQQLMDDPSVHESRLSRVSI